MDDVPDVPDVPKSPRLRAFAVVGLILSCMLLATTLPNDISPMVTVRATETTPSLAGTGIYAIWLYNTQNQYLGAFTSGQVITGQPLVDSLNLLEDTPLNRIEVRVMVDEGMISEHLPTFASFDSAVDMISVIHITGSMENPSNGVTTFITLTAPVTNSYNPSHDVWFATYTFDNLGYVLGDAGTYTLTVGMEVYLVTAP